MDRTIEEPYPDIVPLHPELTQEELRELIEKHVEEDKELTEWPDI